MAIPSIVRMLLTEPPYNPLPKFIPAAVIGSDPSDFRIIPFAPNFAAFTRISLVAVSILACSFHAHDQYEFAEIMPTSSYGCCGGLE